MSSFDLSDFKTDEVKELEGVWVYFDEEETQGLLIARAWNENFSRVFRKLPKGLQHRAKIGTLGKKDDGKIWSRVLAETILLDWKGISDEGKVLKYSISVAREQLKKYKDLRNFVWDTANEEALYHEEEVEEDVKNSQTSSDSD
jgi:hypothetical protein